jgi:hypothetical protein
LPSIKIAIVAQESGVEIEIASAMVKVGNAIRNLAGSPLRGVASTRMLILSARLGRGGALSIARHTVVAGRSVEVAQAQAGEAAYLNGHVVVVSGGSTDAQRWGGVASERPARRRHSKALEEVRADAPVR